MLLNLFLCDLCDLKRSEAERAVKYLSSTRKICNLHAQLLHPHRNSLLYCLN